MSGKNLRPATTAAGPGISQLGLTDDVRTESRIVMEMAGAGLSGADRASLPDRALTAVAGTTGGVLRVLPAMEPAVIDRIAVAVAHCQVG